MVVVTIAGVIVCCVWATPATVEVTDYQSQFIMIWFCVLSVRTYVAALYHNSPFVVKYSYTLCTAKFTTIWYLVTGDIDIDSDSVTIRYDINAAYRMLRS